LFKKDRRPTQGFFLSSPNLFNSWRTHSSFPAVFTGFFQKERRPTQGFFLSSLNLFNSWRTHSSFRPSASSDLFKKKEDPLKHSYLFTGFVLSSSCSFNSTSHSPNKLHRNLRLQSQNLSWICDCCDKDRDHNNPHLRETAEKFAKED
jgi:hypothetical protein